MVENRLRNVGVSLVAVRDEGFFPFKKASEKLDEEKRSRTESRPLSLTGNELSTEKREVHYARIYTAVIKGQSLFVVFILFLNCIRYLKINIYLSNAILFEIQSQFNQYRIHSTERFSNIHSVTVTLKVFKCTMHIFNLN